MSTWRIRRTGSDIERRQLTKNLLGPLSYILRSLSKGDAVKKIFLPWILLLGCAMSAGAARSQKGTEAPKPADSGSKSGSDTWSGLELRSIGPGIASGRISDIAVDPGNPHRYFVAVASGGV